MDGAKTRPCCRKREVADLQAGRGSKQICLNMTRETYDRIWENPTEVRAFIEEQFQQTPELFPPGMKAGFRLTGHLPESAKLPGIRLRQLRVKDEDGGEAVYSLRPCFVMPYMAGFANDLQYPLELLAHGVPAWLVAKGFGHDAHFWDRHVERLGRNSLVGTTVRDADKLPEHLVADEHHADWCGKKGYLPMTAGGGCILGIAVTESADEAHLAQAYGTFQAEALQVDPDYAPKSVNTDGWTATQNAWTTLFPTVALILCYLHGFLKIRDRCRKAFSLHRRIWDAFRAATADEFTQLLKKLQQETEAETWPTPVRDALAKLWNRVAEYARAYGQPGCRRTSNMVDRLMNRLTRVLYAHRGLHGHQRASELRQRGWALLLNFVPFAPRAGQPRTHDSPAHRLNQKRYHDQWLQNLMLSSSLGGFHTRT